MAGGTDIVPLLKKKLIAPQFVVNLKAVKGLKGVQKKRGVLEIGCSTTLRELAADAAVKAAVCGLHEAAVSVAAPAIRNVASLGGNVLQGTRCLYFNQSELFRAGLEPCHKRGGSVCHAVRGSRSCFSVYQGDVAPALVALNAQAEVLGNGARKVVPVEDLFSGNGKKPFKMKPNEVLTRFYLSLTHERSTSCYEKLRFRGAIDYPIVSCAVHLSLRDDSVVDVARVVLGGCGPAPKLLKEAGAILLGTRGEISAIEEAAETAGGNLRLANNTGVPAEYRRRMVPVIVRRAIVKAFEKTREDH